MFVLYIALCRIWQKGTILRAKETRGSPLPVGDRAASRAQV